MDKFWSKVLITTSCWLWDAYKSKNGYGTFRTGDVKRYAHRVVLESRGVEIPPGYHVDHLCRVRHCVNPDHLEVVTPLENARRGETGRRNRIKTHCPVGHEYTQTNECRVCLECRRLRDRIRNRNKRAKGTP